MMTSAFVSYRSAQRADADRIAHRLRASGLDVWLDREKIYDGETSPALAQVVAGVDAIVVVLGAGVFDSQAWVVRELAAALFRTQVGPAVTVLFATVDDWPVPSELKRVTVDVRSEDGLAALVQRLSIRSAADVAAAGSALRAIEPVLAMLNSVASLDTTHVAKARELRTRHVAKETARVVTETFEALVSQALDDENKWEVVESIGTSMVVRHCPTGHPVAIGIKSRGAFIHDTDVPEPLLVAFLHAGAPLIMARIAQGGRGDGVTQSPVALMMDPAPQVYWVVMGPGDRMKDEAALARSVLAASASLLEGTMLAPRLDDPRVSEETAARIRQLRAIARKPPTR